MHDKAKELKDSLYEVEIRDKQRYLLRSECSQRLGPWYLICKDHVEGDEGMWLHDQLLGLE